MSISEVTLRRVDLPLSTPYRLSYRTFETFEPIVIEIRDCDGREGWGEQHISPGSSEETREGGWAFAGAFAERIVGLDVQTAIETITSASAQSKVAATALVTALEMLERPAILETESESRLQLLTPFNATDASEVAEEVERRLDEGFRTFKIKVGKDLRADLDRVSAIQDAANGRATLRIDANRAFSREDAISFATSIDPQNIALFEQPCSAEDWEANAAVAKFSLVPLMLDEPICAPADIDHAAEIDGVGLCKVKLKRFGSMAGLEAAINQVKTNGMNAVLGDGLGSEINCWMEACVARRTVENAGEFNGYLKVRPEARLLECPLGFEQGEMVIPSGFWPQMDRKKLDGSTLASERFAK